MKIIMSPRAEKQLRKLPKFEQIAVAQKIRSFLHATIQNQEKLRGYKDIFRVRVGDYRIVFRRSRVEIYIVLIRHRREVYRMLKEILD